MESSLFRTLTIHRYKLLICLGMALLLMGAKLWMIDAVGNTVTSGKFVSGDIDGFTIDWVTITNRPYIVYVAYP